MNWTALILLLMLWTPLLRAETEISAPETGVEQQETTSDQEWEAKGIIPEGGFTASTQPVTPITMLPPRNAHDSALAELAVATDLSKKGKNEAASDVALQAYDDLRSLRMPRRNKKQRQKLRQERRQAATVYTDSSLAYIQEFVKKKGGGDHAKEEGRARLRDLYDVAQNYPELNKKLKLALAAYEPEPPPPPPAVAVSTASVAVSTVTLSTGTTKN